MTEPARSDRERESERSLARLTFAKGVSNTSLRWFGPFLPTLESAFGATTTQLTTILGIGELAGLSTLLTGRQLDRGRERLIVVLGMVATSVGCLVALVGTTLWFAAAVVLVVFGVVNVTAAGRAFIGRRVPYERRGRAIGLFETSWALSLLVGAPIVAVLIGLAGWRGPFAVLAVANAGAAALVARAHVRAVRAARTAPSTSTGVEALEPAVPGEPGNPFRLPLRAWLTVAGSGFIGFTGLAIFAISGAWLDDAFGVSTGGLGVVAMGFGAVELASSLSSARFADRWGKLRSTVAGLALLIVGLGIMSIADDRLSVGVIGILTFLVGFEFAIVTSISLVTEAAPEARGRAGVAAAAAGTIARAGGAVASGWLYSRSGVDGSAAIAAAGSALAIVLFLGGSAGSEPTVS